MDIIIPKKFINTYFKFCCCPRSLTSTSPAGGLPFVWEKNLANNFFSKSISLIPLECHFETLKFKFSDIENPANFVFTSKFQFFVDQNA